MTDSDLRSEIIAASDIENAPETRFMRHPASNTLAATQ